MCDADDEEDVIDQDNDECVCIAMMMMMWMMMNVCVFMCNYDFFLLCACLVIQALVFLSLAILCANILCNAPRDFGALYRFVDYDTLREYSVRCAMRLSFQMLVFARI